MKPKEQQDYIQDLAEIRSMMERSSKFLSLSGWSGIMAGIYALTAAFMAYQFLDFYPDSTSYQVPHLPQLIITGLVVLVLAIGTAIFLSSKKAAKKNENGWNAVSKRLLSNMAVPLLTGGLLIIILLVKDLAGLAAPVTLIFYGLALYNASKFTYDDLKFLGLTQIGLGLISLLFIEYSLLLWAAGFGIVHIGYGIYMHFRYEK